MQQQSESDLEKLKPHFCWDLVQLIIYTVNVNLSITAKGLLNQFKTWDKINSSNKKKKSQTACILLLCRNSIRKQIKHGSIRCILFLWKDTVSDNSPVVSRASCLMNSKSSLMLMKTSCLTPLQTPSFTLCRSPFKLPQFPALKEQLSLSAAWVQCQRWAELLLLLLMELPIKSPHAGLSSFY